MALKFPRDVTQFRRLSRDEAGISRGIGERFCANSSCQLIKKWDISRGASDKIMRNFHGFWFLALEFPRDVTQFCEFSRDEALFSLGNFQG